MSDFNQLFDSLPYYDNDLDQFPGLKEKVDREFGREPKPPATLHPRVPPPPSLFANNPLLKAELQRVESHQEFPRLDTLRYQLPAPSLPGTDEEWQAALKNAEAQLEHQRIRQTNLQLLQTYGPNAWRIHNYLLETTVKQAEKALEEMKELTVEVNRERKNTQTQLGKELNSLETRWTELISNVLQIELANSALDAEVNRLNRREAELAELARHHVRILPSIQLTNNVPLQQPTPVRNLVPLGSHGPTQTKKFSAVNINKKFLEKNSTTSPYSSTTTSNSAAKLSGAAVRPISQSTPTHSRLVTTKLTTASQGHATGPGWSRPSSATPPTSTTPTINGSGDASTSTTAPTIQPQSRPARQRDMGGGTNKPAWGNAKTNQQRPNVASQMEFPTAAEVAAAPRKSRPALADRNVASKETMAAMQQAAAASKQARMEEADTFRGVHLDPNAHHWDEMEEDDDNFLDGVLDFGDGRQYKIEATDLPTDASSATLVTANSLTSLPSPPSTASQVEEPQNGPVSKEDRFADDFDRSWPRSRASPSVSTRDLPTGPSSVAGPSPVSPALSMLHSPQEPPGSRGMLFNERSNKLEPYNKGVVNQKRGSDGFVSPTEARGRDSFQHRGRVSGNDRPSRVPPASQSGPRPPQNTWNQRKEGDEVRGRPQSDMGPPAVPTRQKPPHLSTAGPPRRTSTSRDSRQSETPSSARLPPSQSPALSHTSAVAQSPVAALAQLSTTELNEARKDVMQTAAARAKARRQQEEEEREREKERAKRKAAEIEEKIAAEKTKVQEVHKSREQEALEVIESAVKMVQVQPQRIAIPERPIHRRASEASPQTTFESRPPVPRKITSSTSVPSLAPVDTQGSWRSKPSAGAVTPSPQTWERPTPAPAQLPPPAFVAPPTALEQVESLANDDLEVVDFSDLGKFVGDSDEQANVPTVVPRPSRPSAIDFFDDRPSEAVPTEKIGPTTWRRHEPGSRSIDADITAPLEGLQPTNRTPRKEAAMSTLDDVMSRIKGALDTMQTSERERRSPEVSAAGAIPRGPAFLPSSRWVPPAFRPRPSEPPEPREELVTGCEPPRSPKPAWNTFVIRLPKSSQALEPLSRKQLNMTTRPTPLRWDILSFDPPVEGMNKKDLSINEILFRRVPGKGKFKVLLPNSQVSGPKVNVPPISSRPTSFVRSPSDALSTWRKAPATGNDDQGLATVSRSPPPELPSETPITSFKSEDAFTARSRPEPKMPVGSSVAFYRDSVEMDGQASVNFIVNSELEATPNKLKPSILVSSPSASDLLATNGTPFNPRANGSAATYMPSLISNSKTESKSSEDSTDRTPITPPSHPNATWARTSLSGSGKTGPDPEHLKAVWSQSSNQAAPVNSLEGIADDLTAIPFTLQDVKSEDGGTPPPTATSQPLQVRLSEHQFRPPSTSAPVARPPPANYSYQLPPPPSQMMRPTYGAYSPIQTPAIIYPMAPSPIPRQVPVNGHAPLYSQPVWMTQNPPAMMRPPYPQLMPYPTPAGTPMAYQGAPLPQPNGSRGRGMPPQNIMYPASPILMQAPPMPVGYMAMHPPAGRGQMRTDNGHPPQQPPPMPSPSFTPVPPTSFVHPTW
ncbi:hypothetical protein MIND_00455600 [Mycena indigotica]|uniref:Uncharacterized protein n=1 Tax=Mycena indigotica TaxID=2126181 RepID=A0A8H6SXT9_9AGAR|nr:uncharacterized protein MIND_00455600 [Mycena indigotica]KAF7306641.1 hypothetical protein MIND_00455600 [Mycena indigotica]